MRRSIVFTVILLAALASCKEDYWEQDYSDRARAVLDRVVGKYELEGISWDGGPVDANGDGMTADKDLTEEIRIPNYSVYAKVDKEDDNRWGYDGKMFISVNVNALDYNRSSWENAYLYVHFNVRSGDFEPNLKDVGWRNDYVKLENYDITLLEGERFVLSADTRLYDYLTEEAVDGRISWTFRCISGKGRIPTE